MEHAIRLRGVGKTYRGNVRALAGVNLEIGAGELVALIGANGSGKSTLLNVLTGILRPDEGSAEILGFDPVRDRTEVRSRTGFVGQEVSLDPEITGRETLRLFYALRGGPGGSREKRLATLIGEFGMESFCDRRVETWSGGQRQRLHLALETIHDPPLLILDEPTTGLDPDGTRRLWDRLADWSREGRTILLSSHDLADVSERCTRVLLLHGGRIIADGSPAELINAHDTGSTVITLEQDSPEEERALHEALRTLPGSPEVLIDGKTVTLRHGLTGHDHEALLRLLDEQGIEYERLERRRPSLAGLYFRLTGNVLAPTVPGKRPGRNGRGRGRGQGRKA